MWAVVHSSWHGRDQILVDGVFGPFDDREGADRWAADRHAERPYDFWEVKPLLTPLS